MSVKHTLFMTGSQCFDRVLSSVRSGRRLLLDSSAIFKNYTHLWRFYILALVKKYNYCILVSSACTRMCNVSLFLSLCCHFVITSAVSNFHHCKYFGIAEWPPKEFQTRTSLAIWSVTAAESCTHRKCDILMFHPSLSLSLRSKEANRGK